MPEVRQRLRMIMPESLHGLLYVLRSAGHAAYVVGGAVRDTLLGLAPKDYDVATSATPDDVIACLRGIGAWKTNETGRSFGVVRAQLVDVFGGLASPEYEIATFRRDVGVGRRPDHVVFTTIEEDVARRDFTVNALFYDPHLMEVVDLVGGLADMRSGLLRTVGRPQDRFSEDRLRIVRAIRFVTRLGYDLDTTTYQAIKDDPSLEGVSAERTHDELVRAIKGAQNVPALLALIDELGLWGQLLPGLRVSTRLDTLVSSRGIDSSDHVIVMALLLDEHDPHDVTKALLRLKYTKEEAQQVGFLLGLKNIDASTAYGLRQAFAHVGLSREQLSDYFVRRDMPSRAMFDAFVRYIDSPPVSGSDLLAQGYSGRDLGVELRRQEAELFCGLLEEHG